MIYVALHWFLYIWRNSCLFQSSQTGFSRERLSLVGYLGWWDYLGNHCSFGVRPDHVAIAGYLVHWVGKVVASRLGRHGFCLVPGQNKLFLGPWSAGLVLGKESAQGLHLMGLWQGMQMDVASTWLLGRLLLGYWRGPSAGRIAPACVWEWLEPSHRAPSGSAAGTEFSRPASGSKNGHSSY